MTVNTPIKTLAVLLLLLGSLALASYSAASTPFTATVDRTALSVEETLTLKLRFYEQVMFGEPDVSQLQQNFDILGKHRNQQYRSINGKAESWTQWQITLAPKRSGKLLIPSFSFKDSYTDAIEIQVDQATVYSGKTRNQPVFMEVSLDKSSAFVQEQVIYTVKLFTSVNLHSLNNSEPDLDNALLKKVGDSQYQKSINGVTYAVVETRYALFPQQSGLLTIPSTLWSVVTNEPRQRRDPFMSDPFFGRGGKKINLRTPEKVVNVLPQPATYDAAVWLPAESLDIQQSWSQSPDSFVVGEPITRTIRIKAKGVLASQLPPLTIDNMTGLSYYPDQPQSDEQLNSDGVTTVKQESYAIVAQRPGTITLPAISLTWWDTETERVREAHLPVQQITIAAAPNSTLQAVATTPEPIITDPASTQAPDQQTASGSSLWFYTTLISCLTSVAFLSLWLRARRAPIATNAQAEPVKSPPATSLKQLFAELDQGDPLRARRALIHWGQVFYEQPQLSRLEGLASLAEHSGFSADLHALDSLLYGSEEKRLPPALIDSLKTHLRALQQQPAKEALQQTEVLPPLYR